MKQVHITPNFLHVLQVKSLLHLKGSAVAIHSNHVCTGWYLLDEACCGFSWTALLGSKFCADYAYPTA